MAFLSLSTKPSVKAKASSATQPGEQSNATQPAQADGSGSGEQLQTDDKDDEWYDTSGTSSEDPSPIKPTRTPKMSDEADGENSIVSMKQATKLEEEKLLPYVPSLFGLDLPPCGPEMQVAYELLVHRLRKHWLSHSGHLSTIDAVQKVQVELRNQNYLWPSSSLKGRNRSRKPWCRETVFKHQLQWIDYFQREAEHQDPKLMTESELWERKKESDVPHELKIQVERRDILRLWDEWNKKKRAKTTSLLTLDAEAENPLAPKNKDGNQQDDDTGEDSSEEPKFQKTDVDGINDTSIWSAGGHD